ncbi:plastid REDOX insensitive 2, chloroplastic-like protein isoform X1 [Tanacetum coccineum]
MAVIQSSIISTPLTTFIPSVPPRTPDTLQFSTRRTSGCFIRHSTSKTRRFFIHRATPPPKYIYPDPIPEFAHYESNKFREELKKRLYKDKETFGSDLDNVVDTCVELFSEFVHEEYGGPGTLLVDPFTNMFIELKQRRLPGADVAARASLLWAQNYLDHDWQIWNAKSA